MKRLVLVLVVLATTLSCKKEEIKPQTQEPIEKYSKEAQREQVLMLNNKLPH